MSEILVWKVGRGGGAGEEDIADKMGVARSEGIIGN